jgi:hypothetical protein
LPDLQEGYLLLASAAITSKGRVLCDEDQKDLQEMQKSEMNRKQANENNEIERQTDAEQRINLSFQKRDEIWSRNWCSFCGKTDCKSMIHFLKLYTLPRTSLPPKYLFLLTMVPLFILVLLLIVGKVLYLLLTKS